jgi:hypothetical protein
VKPQATSTPSWARRDRPREDRVEEQRGQVDVVEVAAFERLEALPELGQMRDAVDLDSFPSPACSHSDSTSHLTLGPWTDKEQECRPTWVRQFASIFGEECSAAARPATTGERDERAFGRPFAVSGLRAVRDRWTGRRLSHPGLAAGHRGRGVTDTAGRGVA